MGLNKLTPLIYNREINEAVNFYVGVLGFTWLTNKPELGWLDKSLPFMITMVTYSNSGQEAIKTDM